MAHFTLYRGSSHSFCNVSDPLKLAAEHQQHTNNTSDRTQPCPNVTDSLIFLAEHNHHISDHLLALA